MAKHDHMCDVAEAYMDDPVVHDMVTMAADVLNHNTVIDIDVPTDSPDYANGRNDGAYVGLCMAISSAINDGNGWYHDCAVETFVKVVAAIRKDALEDRHD